MCGHRDQWGFDAEDGCFRCSGCGELLTDPPAWLKKKYAEAIAAFEKRLQERLKSFRAAYAKSNT